MLSPRNKNVLKKLQTIMIQNKKINISNNITSTCYLLFLQLPPPEHQKRDVERILFEFPHPKFNLFSTLSNTPMHFS